MKKHGCFYLFLATSAVLMTLMVCGVLAVAFSTDAESTPPHSKIMAFVMCERFVKEKLKSPATAEFAPYREQGVSANRGGRTGAYSVSSYVDAQNDFGAMVRTRFRCDVHYDSVADRWYLDDLQIE